MSVFNALNTAMVSKLSGGAGLTALLAAGTASIYYLQAPDAAALDYVLWDWQAGGDENLSPHRTKNIVLFVRGFSAIGPLKAGQIDAQIDALLHKSSLSVSGWANFWLMREQEFARVEIDAANVKTWMAGAFYRVRLDKT